jgi:hypothetical protein
VRGDAREGTEEVTDQKSLKRRVRTRMTKTGERYTAARRNLLSKSSDEAAGDAATAAPEAPGFRGLRSASDDALVARTGRPWTEWHELLEGWGAIDRPHPEIARWLVDQHGVDGWWAQELTVRYEMASGRRKPGQRPDGFSITSSKTIEVPVDTLYQAFVDDDARGRWLPVDGVKVRTATPHRTARFDWKAGAERLAIGFAAKGDARSTVSVEHSRLPDDEAAAREKRLWKERLADLKRNLEAG